MRQLTADLFTTLDGYAAGERSPAYFGYPGPDLERWIEDQSAAPHVVVMGRVTFEALAAISRRNDDDAARRLTELPKLVVSTTLREPLGWSNARVVASLEELRALREVLDGRLVVLDYRPAGLSAA
jgi:dihydrofolate reductase